MGGFSVVHFLILVIVVTLLLRHRVPPLREWRFSVADLLAAITLAAIMLGFAFYVLRK